MFHNPEIRQALGLSMIGKGRIHNHRNNIKISECSVQSFMHSMFQQAHRKLFKTALIQGTKGHSFSLFLREASPNAESFKSSNDIASVLFTAVAACAVAAHQRNVQQNSAKCDATLAVPPSGMAKKFDTISCSQNEPRNNITLNRLRSKKARSLHEKYDVTWNVVLGHGSYGAVYPCRLSMNGERAALKVLKKKYTDQSSFHREKDALLKIYDNGGHRNISGLRDVYEDSSCYYLVLDMICGGEIFDHLVEDGAFCEADTARLLREAASALMFLHENGIIHADLKPENLMLTSKRRKHGSLKIIDFGSAIVAHDIDKEVVGQSDCKTYDVSTGTIAYWPPERFANGGCCKPTEAMDMWSTGVILYIMLTGIHPFDPEGHASDKEIELRIKGDPTYPICASRVSHLSASAIDLIKKLLEPDPMKRLDAAGMFEHSWFKENAAKRSKQHSNSYEQLGTNQDNI